MQNTYNVHLTAKSKNEKTGPIPVSTTTASTCPASCPFNNGGGCYAASGPLAFHWRKVNDGQRGTDWDSFCGEIAALPDGQLWRHNQAGDLPGDGEEIHGSFLAELITANVGKRGFTYTHYPMTKHNRQWVKAANDSGFTINLSANTLAHADELAALDAGPVVTVLPVEYARDTKKGEWTEGLDAYKARLAALPTETANGRKVVVCPATYRDDLACADCGLCQKAKGRAIVGFPAHGTSKKKASAIAMA